MTSNSNGETSIILVTSNAVQVEDLRARLPCTVYETREYECLSTHLPLVQEVEAVVFYSMPWADHKGLQAARQLSRERPNIEVFIVAAEDNGVITVQALRAKLIKRLPPHSGDRDIALALIDSLSVQRAVRSTVEELIGDCESFSHTKELIRRVAPVDMTVLITGETGTGKELAARAIHKLSLRHDAPFVCVNCAAIPDSLLESELFGYEKGAFTGAGAKQVGKLRSAHHGTIFLDEIGDMALGTQAKILRALESREVQPLGASGSVHVDVRVIAATHQNLERLMADGRFRNDLFFRLNVLPVNLPPLRERPEDIPELVDHFIRELNARYGRDIVGVSKGGLRLLGGQQWPGNVRQLRNVIEGAFVVCESDRITSRDLKYLHWSPATVPNLSPRVTSPTFLHLPGAPEPDRLRKALETTRWNKTKAAELLHWSRMTLYRKMARYHFSLDDHPTEMSEATVAATGA